MEDFIRELALMAYPEKRDEILAKLHKEINRKPMEHIKKTAV